MKYLHIFFIALTLFLLTTESLFATVSYQPLAPLPGIGEGGSSVDFTTYMVGMFNLAIGIAAVLAVVFIILGGIQYMSTDSYTGKTDGIGKVKNALLGLLLAISAYTILYNINPDLAMVNFNLDGIQGPGNINNDFSLAEPTQILRNVFPSGTANSVYHGGGVIVKGAAPFEFLTSTAPDGLAWVERVEGNTTAYNLVGTPTKEGTYTITVTVVDKDGIETVLRSSEVTIHPPGQYVPTNQNLYPLSLVTIDALGGDGYYRSTGVDFWIKNQYYLYGPYTDENALATCQADTEKALEATRRAVSQDYGSQYVKNIFIEDCEEY